MKTKIMLIDDHEFVLQGLQSKLQTVPTFEVVGAYMDSKAFLKGFKHQEVDVIVMDLMLNNIDGFELAIIIKQELKKDVKMILISGVYEEILHKRALELDFKAFLRKEVSYDELISCIINVAQGNIVVPESLLSKPQETLLTNIEKNVLELIFNEYTNEKIAKELFISRRTVESHVTSIFRKLNVSSRIGVVRQALKLKLID